MFFPSEGITKVVNAFVIPFCFLEFRHMGRLQVKRLFREIWNQEVVKETNDQSQRLVGDCFLYVRENVWRSVFTRKSCTWSLLGYSYIYRAGQCPGFWLHTLFSWWNLGGRGICSVGFTGVISWTFGLWKGLLVRRSALLIGCCPWVHFTGKRCSGVSCSRNWSAGRRCNRMKGYRR